MKIAVVGAGPCGLFASYQLLKKGHEVSLYDQMPGAGRKFLVAGHGGLNLTYSEDLSTFSKRYGKNKERFSEYLKDFSPNDLRAFCHELGVETFVGSSGRVFPKKMKAGEMLILWLQKLKENKNFTFYPGHQLLDFSNELKLVFFRDGKQIETSADKIIIALGGGSWKKTGSDGKWISLFEKKGIKVVPFSPMNSGFERKWSTHFLDKIDNDPVKNISLTVGDQLVKGEVMLTKYGIEGGAIYAMSREIRDEIEKKGKANIVFDLLPGLSEEQIIERLSKPRGKNSLSNHFRKVLKISGAKFTLLKELISPEEMKDIPILAQKIKSLSLEVNKTRPLDEAISTSGGIDFLEVDDSLMLKKIPNIYVIGEMLDWDAPTGGYLLQGCFSMAHWVAHSI